MLTDGLEWCGLLWCFYQLFGLSFWRHPFTAEHPLMSEWCSDTFLQIWWRNKLIYILDGLKVSIFSANYHFRSTAPLSQYLICIQVWITSYTTKQGLMSLSNRLTWVLREVPHRYDSFPHLAGVFVLIYEDDGRRNKFDSTSLRYYGHFHSRFHFQLQKQTRNIVHKEFRIYLSSTVTIATARCFV